MVGLTKKGGSPYVFQKGDAYVGIPSGKHGAVYSFPKGFNRVSNGDNTSTTNDLAVAGSAVSGSSFPIIAEAFASVSLGFAPWYSVPVRTELGGLAHHGCLDLELAVLDEVRIGFFRQIFQIKHFSHSVGGGTGSDLLSDPLEVDSTFGSTFFHSVNGGSDAGRHGHGGEEFRFSLDVALQCLIPFRPKFGGGAQHVCLDLEPSLFDELEIGVFRQVLQMEHVFLAIGGGSRSIFKFVGGGTCFSAIGSSIFHSFGVGYGSGSRGHGGEDFVCAVLSLVSAILKIYDQKNPGVVRLGIIDRSALAMAVYVGFKHPGLLSMGLRYPCCGLFMMRDQDMQIIWAIRDRDLVEFRLLVESYEGQFGRRQVGSLTVLRIFFFFLDN